MGLTWLATPTARIWEQVLVIRGDFFSSTLMSELFVGMIALSVTVGLPWRTHVARISQGLGIYSIICILIEAGHSYLGLAHDTQAYATLSHLRMVAYLFCIAYWVETLWCNAPQSKELPDDMRRRLVMLQRRVAYNLYRIGNEGN
jgi:hypothetical protein